MLKVSTKKGWRHVRRSNEKRTNNKANSLWKICNIDRLLSAVNKEMQGPDIRIHVKLQSDVTTILKGVVEQCRLVVAFSSYENRTTRENKEKTNDEELTIRILRT